MLSFSIAVSKDKSSFGLLGDKPAGDSHGYGLPALALGSTPDSDSQAATTKKMLFKDIFSDITNSLTAPTADKDLNLQELLSDDFTAVASAEGADAALVAEPDGVLPVAQLVVNQSVSQLPVSLPTINEEIKCFLQKFADKQVPFDSSNLLVNNVLNDVSSLQPYSLGVGSNALEPTVSLNISSSKELPNLPLVVESARSSDTGAVSVDILGVSETAGGGVNEIPPLAVSVAGGITPEVIAQPIEIPIGYSEPVVANDGTMEIVLPAPGAMDNTAIAPKPAVKSTTSTTLAEPITPTKDMNKQVSIGTLSSLNNDVIKDSIDYIMNTNVGVESSTNDDIVKEDINYITKSDTNKVTENKDITSSLNDDIIKDSIDYITNTNVGVKSSTNDDIIREDINYTAKSNTNKVTKNKDTISSLNDDVIKDSIDYIMNANVGVKSSTNDDIIKEDINYTTKSDTNKVTENKDVTSSLNDDVIKDSIDYIMNTNVVVSSINGDAISIKDKDTAVRDKQPISDYNPIISKQIDTTIVPNNPNVKSRPLPAASDLPFPTKDLNTGKINPKENVSNASNISEIGVADNTPRNSNKVEFSTTVSSSEINDIKDFLSKLLNTSTNSATFGDKDIMLTTHQNNTGPVSAKMDEVLNIQSVEMTSSEIETTQVSDWVKTMPPSKVNYMRMNESYNLLENVVNNIVDKFYAAEASPSRNTFTYNDLSASNDILLEQISLQVDSQTAADYSLKSSPIINEILAKISKQPTTPTNKAPISLWPNDLTAKPQPTTVASQQPVGSADMLVNINDLPRAAKNSNLDIFVHENNWEVLFDISDSNRHVIFRSDFKNTDILSGSQFGEVKLNIMSTEAEADVADSVTMPSKAYTTQTYKPTDIDTVNVLSSAVPEQTPLTTDNSLPVIELDVAEPTLQSEPIARPAEATFGKDKTQHKVLETEDLNIYLNKQLTDIKNIATAAHRKSELIDIEQVRFAQPQPTDTNIKLPTASVTEGQVKSFNLSELVSDKVEAKTTQKQTKTSTKSSRDSTPINDKETSLKLDIKNIVVKSINKEEVDAVDTTQPLYNQTVSESNKEVLPKDTLQSHASTPQPPTIKEDITVDNATQQAANIKLTKAEAEAQPLVNRTFINVKPNEVHRVVWHTTDTMTRESSKTATKTIKIVMNPQSLGDVIVEIKLQENAANVSFKAKSAEALTEIEKNIGSLKDMLTNSDIKMAEFKYEKINTTNESNKNFGEFNQQQQQQQQSKNNQQQAKREFLNSNTNDKDSTNSDMISQSNFYKLVEEYV